MSALKRCCVGKKKQSINRFPDLFICPINRENSGTVLPHVVVKTVNTTDAAGD